MNGGKITHNYSAQDGGGGYLYANTTFVINGGEISYNESVRNEGAVSLENPSTMEMNGGVITENISGAYTAVAPGSSTTIRIGGPVKFYNNYDSSGNQANLRITKASMVTITAPIVSDTGSAFVGITTTLANGTTLTSGFKTNGKYFDYSADIATAFFSDDTSRYIIENSAKTELVTRTGSTGYVDIDWQYQLDNSGVWQSTDGAAYLDLTYGSKVTAVRACVPSDSNAVASDWQEGGSNPTYSFAYYSSPSGASNTTAFNSIQDVGLYTFAMDTFGSYWLTYNNGPSTGVWILFPASFTINISPKPVTINLIDKGSSYGDKIADLYAEEDILDNEGNPTGATIKPEVDPLTPLVGADAGYDLSSFVTISTEAVASSDLGSYNIKGAIKSSAPFDTKNYSFTIKTASYGIGVATITAAISGSNTYNGSAQNSATITFTYPNGSAFAGTKLSTLDYKVNYPTAGCVNAKTYNTDDISVELNNTTNASRFEIAEDGVSGSYEIKKAALSCTADAKSVGYGDDAPEYTVTYSGFKGNDTADTVIKGTLEFACDYTSTSPAGEYTITPSGVTADNYEITFKT
ncbi:MAG: hypothetical protein K2N52_05405, partial [Clostridia bacterium]|nr:hypothetical protein [Clostridia bacterium]